MTATRLDWVAPAQREHVSVEEMRSHDEVVHYSIPNYDMFGGGAAESPNHIESAKLRVRGDELLVSRLNPRKPRVLLTSKHDVLAVCSGEFVVLRPGAGCFPRFLYWRLLADDLTQHFSARVQSVTRSQQRVPAEIIRKLWLDVPSTSEQQRIADYLDAETAHIDKVTAEQRHLIRLMRERRTSELDGWVEHGGAASGDLERVTSPWLDRVPTGWSFLPLKRVVERVMVGIVITPSAYYEDEGVPVLRGLNVRPGRVLADELVFMSEKSNRLHAKSILRAGDVVVVRTGLAGAAAAVPHWAVGGNAVDLLVVRPGVRMSPTYLEYLLNSRLVQRQVTHGAVGALQSHFNTSSLANVAVTVPPPGEQASIVGHLVEELSRYDELIAEAEAQIDLLQERRQALITHAVTQGIDGLPGVA